MVIYVDFTEFVQIFNRLQKCIIFFLENPNSKYGAYIIPRL